MRLWIVEKPDVARNLAAGLAGAMRTNIVNGGSTREDGYFQLATGDRVLPLLGHLLEMAPLSEYISDEQQRTGNYFPLLPLQPAAFKYRPRSEHGDARKGGSRGGGARGQRGAPARAGSAPGRPMRQYTVAIAQIRAAKEIVNAGDIDREGQLIVDELLAQAGVDPLGSSKPVWRFPLVSVNEADIAKALGRPMDRNGDAKWLRRREAALARQHGDWLLGMNGSLAYQTVTGMRSLSVGRVQTPVLNMIVRRDEAVESFKPRDYFTPVITLRDGTQMRWYRRAGAENTPGFDEEGRIVDRAVAQRIVDLIRNGLSGTINIAESKSISEPPPLPFSQGTLQATASRVHGLSVEQVKRAAQTLYERHKAITYVGTDCQYLPQSMLDGAANTLAALGTAWPREASGASSQRVSRAWNDSKVDEHFAIIPTGTMPKGLTEEERAVFETISRRYIAQFHANFEYLRHRLGAMFGQDEFRATTRQTVTQGWRSVEQQVVESQSDPNADETEGDDESGPRQQGGASRPGRQGA